MIKNKLIINGLNVIDINRNNIFNNNLMFPDPPVFLITYLYFFKFMIYFYYFMRLETGI